MEAVEKLPTSFWIIAGVGLVWNLIGLASFGMQMVATPEQIAGMYETEAEVAYISSIPAWANGAYGLAVIAGVLGCIALLMRKGVAKVLFGLSLAGILVQNVYGFVVANGIGVFGVGAIALPIVVIVVGVALLIYAGRAESKGWVT